jgi:NAD(P)-dependent dehydrogenase (short-subunit alcohol dehydrogenase family)
MGERIFVTGGASGLGRAIAVRFARAGWRVAIGDVNEARGAEALAGAADAVLLRCDVAREEDLAAVARRLEERWGGVDVVVNNAGVASGGAIDEVSIDEWRRVLDVNLLGVVRGCRVFVPVLKRQGGGHLVNVASMAGLLDVPLMASYNAPKAAVVSLSETLQHELAEHGIAVTVVCPSFFRTNLAESFQAADPALRAVTEGLFARSPISADDIAEDVFRAVRRRELYVLPHPGTRSIWALKRLLPRGLYAPLFRRQARRLRHALDRARAELSRRSPGDRAP